METFDPQTATCDEWRIYLLDPKSHSRDWDTVDEEKFFLFSHLQKKIGLFCEKEMSVEEREKAVKTAVTAALEVWEFLADFKVDQRTGGTHPFMSLPQLAYAGEEPVPNLVESVQRLWSESPRPLKYQDRGFSLLLEGLGEIVPIDNDELERVYYDHFNLYKMDVIEILLRRGSLEQAERLFRERVEEYPAIDPLHMKHLVYWGMPVETMEIWLNQGLNGEDSHSYVRESARKKWKEILDHKSSQQA